MEQFIEAIAHGDFSAILGLITTLLSGTFGTILTVVSCKFLQYKKSVEDIVSKTEKKLIPAFKEIVEESNRKVIDPVRADLKVIAESVALSVNKDTSSKIALLENISKVGISAEIQESVEQTIQEEIKADEEKQAEVKAVIEKLESNKLETL